MFGYLRPFKEELRLKDIKKYSSYYCALCNEIRKDYGKFWTLFLNYESVYILLYLESYMKNEKEENNITCHINPFMKKTVQINNENLKYAAFINMLLLELKFEDDKCDEGNVLYGILQRRLSKKKIFQNLSCDHEELVEALKEQSLQLKELEEKRGTIDSCADTTGIMLSIIIDYRIQNCQSNFEERNESKKLHYYIGKLIYILDAFEDFERDIKKNQFNPMNHMSGTQEERNERIEKIIFLLQFSIRREIKKVALAMNVDIINNILIYGIGHTVERIKREKKKKCIQSVH